MNLLFNRDPEKKSYTKDPEKNIFLKIKDLEDKSFFLEILKINLF